MTDIKRSTHTIDATGKPVGRLASEIAILLRGKNKPSFTPHLDEGDAVHVKHVNAMVFTGKKLDQKLYHRSTRYPGGIRTRSAKELMEQRPEDVLRMAVEHMLPATKLRNGQMKRLTIERD